MSSIRSFVLIGALFLGLTASVSAADMAVAFDKVPPKVQEGLTKAANGNVKQISKIEKSVNKKDKSTVYIASIPQGDKTVLKISVDESGKIVNRSKVKE